jgi:hypothetical protein
LERLGELSMWIFTPIGFFSVVAHRDKPHTVLVRSRARRDLETFRNRYCKRLGKIKYIAWADYPYRAEVGRRAYANAMRRVCMDVTYDNFKSAVKDNQRHSVYMRVWGVMRDAESRGQMGDKKAARRNKTLHHRGQESLFGRWSGKGWQDSDYWGTKDKGNGSQPREANGRFKSRDAAIPPLRKDPPKPLLLGPALDEREEQMARDAGLLPDVIDSDMYSDPFGWDDGLGSSYRSDRETEPPEDDDVFVDLCDPEDCENDPPEEGPEVAHDPNATLEFDSLADVIEYFRKKD